MIRAQLVTDWLPRKFPAAVRAAVLFYAPLLLHVDHQGAGIPTFTRASTAQGTWRDGALHTVAANEPVFEYAGESKRGLLYGATGVAGRVANDALGWGNGLNLTVRDQVGTIACVIEEPTGTPNGLAMTYDYGTGQEKTYDRTGLADTTAGLSQPPSFHDGYLTNAIFPFNRRVRHVCTFTRLLTVTEIAALIALLEAN